MVIKYSEIEILKIARKVYLRAIILSGEQLLKMVGMGNRKYIIFSFAEIMVRTLEYLRLRWSEI